MKALAMALLMVVGCRTHSVASTPDAATVATVAVSAPPPVPVVESAKPAPRDPAPKIATDWCIEGLEALDEETCYLLPPAADPPRRLLIYLHGIIPPLPQSPQKRTVESVVRDAATRAGYAVMIPRGRRGIGPAQSQDWWAWPTTASDYAKYAENLAAGWIARKDALAAIAGGPFARTYLAGSSNGAYFLTALALHGAVSFDGFGAMSGGSAAGLSAAAIAGVPKKPFYVGYGSYDETNTGPKALAALLAAAGWKNRVAVHAVAHGAKEIYLDEAFAFWDAEAR